MFLELIDIGVILIVLTFFFLGDEVKRIYVFFVMLIII